MICKNCGKEYDDAYQFCPNCGTAKEVGMRYCPQCGKSLDGNISECPHCHWHATIALTFELSKKKRATAMTYLYVLGIFGAHRFYVGKTDSGALMLASSIVALSLFIVGLVLIGLFSLFVGYALMIIGLIVLIIESIFLLNDRHALLAGTFTDSDGQYLS